MLNIKRNSEIIDKFEVAFSVVMKSNFMIWNLKSAKENEDSKRKWMIIIFRGILLKNNS